MKQMDIFRETRKKGFRKTTLIFKVETGFPLHPRLGIGWGKGYIIRLAADGAQWNQGQKVGIIILNHVELRLQCCVHASLV